MTLRRQLRTLTWAACMALAVVSGAARAQEVPLITGQHWTGSSEEMKKAYLVGIANIAHVEIVFAGNNPPTDAQSILPRLAKGLRGQTLDGVRDTLNKWYAANPSRLDRPVIETIWFELVVPGLQKNK